MLTEYGSQLVNHQPEYAKEKDLQLMVACGPYTTNDSLSYQAIKDLLEIVKKDRPHGLILMGPFLDQLHSDIYSGEVYYEDPSTSNKVFVDYEELFTHLINTISKELEPYGT
jgi:hypothetical protein